MTLIASLNNDINPVFIGDIAISSNSDNPSIKWPTIGNIRNVFDCPEGFIVSGYTQKISLINDSLVIAWAGSKIHARMIVSEIIESSKKEILTFRAIVKIIEDNKYEIEGNLSLIACFIEKKSSDKCIFNRFQIGCNEVHSGTHGRCISAGTGTEHFEKVLNTYNESTPKDFELDNYVNTSINKACSITSWLYYLEHTNYEPLLNYFGGGYEICYMEGGAFKKLNNFSSIYWSIEITEDGKTNDIRVHKIHHTQYHHDICVFSVIDDVTYNGSEYIVENIDHFLVPPIHRSIDESEVQNFKPIIETGSFCHMVEIIFGDEKIKWLRVMEIDQQKILEIKNIDGLYSIKPDYGLMRDQIEIFLKKI